MNINTINLIKNNSHIKFASKEEKIETNNYPKEKVGGIKASIASIVASRATMLGTVPIAIGLIFPAIERQGNIPEAEIKTLKEAANKIIKDSGLKTKGVNIKWAKPFKKPQNWIEIIKADINDPIAAVKNGRNAFFINKDGVLPSGKYGLVPVKKNTILMPENKITFAVFHELGHAMNANLSKAGKTLQQLRPLAMFSPIIIALYGAFSRKSKPDENGNLTTKQKINNAIRNNAGKLAVACTIPMLIEEGMATKKGLDFAKKLLSPDLYKKVTKGSKIAFLSYISNTVFAGLGAWVAVKVKNNIIEKKERKQEELYNAAIAS
jgi:hypothetical protein